MTTQSAQYTYQPKDSGRQYRGIAVVVAIHLLLAWAVVSGTAKKGLEIIKKPLEAVVIQEVIIPPPPPPPIKEIKPPEVKAPKMDAPPPPPFVPPPEVATQQTTAPAIASIATPPTTPAVIAPPVADTPTPAPVKPSRLDIGMACPTQVAPEMPKRAAQDGTSGVVRAQVLIKDGSVREVTILSGPRVFHAAVKAAMMQYRCTVESGEVSTTQEFTFKNE